MNATELGPGVVALHLWREFTYKVPTAVYEHSFTVISHPPDSGPTCTCMYMYTCWEQVLVVLTAQDPFAIWNEIVDDHSDEEDE